MSFYGGMQALVERSLKVYGTAVTVTHGGTGYSMQVMKRNPSSKEIDGTSVLMGDAFLTIAAKGATITPTIGDRVSIGGVTWEIVSPVVELAPAASTLFWRAQVRK